MHKIIFWAFRLIFRATIVADLQKDYLGIRLVRGGCQEGMLERDDRGYNETTHYRSTFSLQSTNAALRHCYAELGLYFSQAYC